MAQKYIFNIFIQFFTLYLYQQRPFESNKSET